MNWFRTLAGSSRKLSPEPLRLPRGVRLVSEQDGEDGPELLRQRVRDSAPLLADVVLTTGYVVKPGKAGQYAAAIEANVHADMLWRTVQQLTNALLPIVAAPIIGIKGELPAFGPYTHRERALGVFEPFTEHLTHDGFLEWGIMCQYYGETEEVFVKSPKYLQIWTYDLRRARKTLERLGVPEVPELKFIDNYPFVSESLPLEGRSSGWPVVLERITASFATLHAVEPP